MGSGTLAVAMKELTIKENYIIQYIGYEINQDYIEIINKRLEGIK